MNQMRPTLFYIGYPKTKTHEIKMAYVSPGPNYVNNFFSNKFVPLPSLNWAKRHSLNACLAFKHWITVG